MTRKTHAARFQSPFHLCAEIYLSTVSMSVGAQPPVCAPCSEVTSHCPLPSERVV